MPGARSALRAATLLVRTAPDWLGTAWWGLVGARVGAPVEVVQAVILRDGEVLLALRRNLRGWELPGGNLEPGEAPEVALRREVWEETGLAVAIEGLTGTYLRSGFLPHRARVYRCQPGSGSGIPAPMAAATRSWVPAPDATGPMALTAPAISPSTVSRTVSVTAPTC